MMKLWESNFSQACDCSRGGGYAWSQVPFRGGGGYVQRECDGYVQGVGTHPPDMGPGGDGYSLPSGTDI